MCVDLLHSYKAFKLYNLSFFYLARLVAQKEQNCKNVMFPTTYVYMENKFIYLQVSLHKFFLSFACWGCFVFLMCVNVK